MFIIQEPESRIPIKIGSRIVVTWRKAATNKLLTYPQLLFAHPSYRTYARYSIPDMECPLAMFFSLLQLTQ